MTRLCYGLLLAVIVGGCTRAGKAQPPPRGRVVLPFAGEVDPAAGTIRITQGVVQGDAAAPAFVELPVVQDGRAGSGPADTVELVTESTGVVPGGCGAVDSFAGSVRLRSFYAGAVLTNAYAEITSATPIGHEGCNSAQAPAGLSAQYGLFAYGTVGAAGTPGDSAVATWSFGLSSSEAFTFHGRIVADLVEGDVTAPTVAATPPAGTYGAAQSVTLACSDAESGCRAIYFTTDGTDPTAASSVYAGPIAVTSRAQVRFLAADHAGNASAVQIASYDIDTSPPQVQSVSPRDGKTNVATGTAITVSFSEPMQVATTAAAIAVTDGSGPLSVTLSVDGRGQAFTFTPLAPLALASRYTVTVAASARDLAGNAAVPFQATFTTPAPVVQVSGATAARHANGAVAYEPAGNALSVWTANTVSGFRIVGSYYTSDTNTWGAPIELTSVRLGPTDAVSPPVVKVTRCGSGYVLGWTVGDRVQAVPLSQGTKPTWGQLLTTRVSAPEDWALAEGSSDCVLLAANDGGVTAHAWSGGLQWASSTVAAAGRGACDPVLSWSGTTWVAGWRERLGPVRVATFDPATSSWSADVAIPSPSAQVDAIRPAIATYGVATYGWTTVLFSQAGVVKAATSASGLAFDTPDTLSAGAVAASSLALAVSPDLPPAFAAAWLSAEAGAVHAYGAVRIPTWGLPTWSAPALLEASAEVVQSLSLGRTTSTPPTFAAVMSIGASPAGQVWVQGSNPYGWYPAADAVRLDDGRGDARRAAAAIWGAFRSVVTWDQDDGSGPRIHAATFYGAPSPPTAETPTVLSGPPPEGSVRDLRTASRGGGEIMAVWAQDERPSWAVYAALHSGAGWSAPVLVASGALAPAIATNGTTYLVAFQQWNAATRAWDVAAAEWNGITFDPATVLTTDAVAPAVASDGTGYASAWAAGSGGLVGVRIREAGAWGAATVIGSPAAQASLPALAARAGEYLLVYLGRASETVTAQRAIRSAGTWTWTPGLPVGPALAGADRPPAIAVGGAGGYGVAWYRRIAGGASDSGEAYASTWTGSGWSSSYLESGPSCPTSNPPLAIAALGAGYRVASSCTGLLTSLEYTQGAWTRSTWGGLQGDGVVVSTDASRYRMLAVLSASTPFRAATIDWLDGSPQTPEVVDTLDFPGAVWGDLALPWDGVAHVGIWTRPADVPSDRVQARWSP